MSHLLTARKVAFASLIGTTIEWYDFFIFGTAAALIFNELVAALVIGIALVSLLCAYLMAETFRTGLRNEPGPFASRRGQIA